MKNMQPAQKRLFLFTRILIVLFFLNSIRNYTNAQNFKSDINSITKRMMEAKKYHLQVDYFLYDSWSATKPQVHRIMYMEQENYHIYQKLDEVMEKVQTAKHILMVDHQEQVIYLMENQQPQNPVNSFINIDSLLQVSGVKVSLFEGNNREITAWKINYPDNSDIRYCELYLDRKKALYSKFIIYFRSGLLESANPSKVVINFTWDFKSPVRKKNLNLEPWVKKQGSNWIPVAPWTNYKFINLQTK